MSLTLIEAARAIVRARDYFAEHGEYDPKDFGPTQESGQCFDDWAADILATALEATPAPPFAALFWMLAEVVESSTERVTGLELADAVRELDDVAAVLDWLKVAGMPEELWHKLDGARLHPEGEKYLRDLYAADKLRPFRVKALDALARAERLNAEFCAARDAGLTQLAASLDPAVQHAASLADSYQLDLLKESGIEPDHTAPEGTPAAIAALLDQGAATAAQIEAFGK